MTGHSSFSSFPQSLERRGVSSPAGSEGERGGHQEHPPPQASLYRESSGAQGSYLPAALLAPRYPPRGGRAGAVAPHHLLCAPVAPAVGDVGDVGDTGQAAAALVADGSGRMRSIAL